MKSCRFTGLGILWSTSVLKVKIQPPDKLTRVILVIA